MVNLDKLGDFPNGNKSLGGLTMRIKILHRLITLTTYFDELQAMEVPIAESLQKMILINALPRALIIW